LLMLKKLMEVCTRCGSDNVVDGKINRFVIDEESNAAFVVRDTRAFHFKGFA